MALAAHQNAHDQNAVAAVSVKPDHDVEVVDEWIHHNGRLHAKAIKNIEAFCCQTRMWQIFVTSPVKKNSDFPNYINFEELEARMPETVQLERWFR